MSLCLSLYVSYIPTTILLIRLYIVHWVGMGARGEENISYPKAPHPEIGNMPKESIHTPMHRDVRGGTPGMTGE